MSGGRLVVLDAAFGDIVLEVNAAAPFHVTVESAAGLSADEIVTAAANADGVLVRYLTIDDDLMSRCPGWRVIGRYGVGVDNVDMVAATRRGIAVINVPDYCTEEVATHTAALILAGWRKLRQSYELVAEGRWDDWAALRPVSPLSACTLGLVGAGRIGAEVARLMAPFFAQIIAYDPVSIAALPAVEMVGLDELFAASDVVSLHCPLTPQTRDLVDARRLEAMKPGALLVNVSRGGLVDTEALARGLRNGQPAGAALDVLPSEPPAADDPLRDAPNVLLTNHVGWYSEQALRQLRHLVSERCAAYLVGDPVQFVVNQRDLARRSHLPTQPEDG